jgi:hypothetical protein
MGFFGSFRAWLRGSPPPPKHAAWDDPVDIAALTLPEVAAGQKPVLIVVHDVGLGNGLGGWLFLDGPNMQCRSPVGIAKVDLLKMDATLAEITDLPVGWQAIRESPGMPWKREKSS